MTLSPAWLDELRARTLLSALISRTLKLTKAGREYKGCCPFHNEKTPSFYVNDEKGFYHCFGCSAHGDAIRWMTDQRGLSFMDAVKELADAAGMDLPAPDPRAAERAEHANSLYDVMAGAKDWFSQQLQGIEGGEACSYLEKRGLSKKIIAEFGLGFAPDSKGKLKAALAHFGNEKLIEAGLLISVDEKEPYDRFRGRLMIPIRDPRGRVIAFGGRTLGAGEPKYLNSPDTPLFDKGRTLYNLDKAGAACRQAGRILVVEGYLDVIALAGAGIGEAVAPLGTALTEAQLSRLWRHHDTPLLCFDGDNAGQRAAVRAAARALPGLSPSRSLAFVSLPAGQDPDDLIKVSGRAGIEAVIAQAVPLVDQLWSAELTALPLSTPEAKAGLRQRLNERVQTISDPDVRSQYQLEMRSRFESQFGSAKQSGQWSGKRFAAFANREPTGQAKKVSGGGVEPIFARAILSGLLRHPSQILVSSEALAALNLADAEHDRMRITLLDAAYDNAMLDSDAIIAICDSVGLHGLTRELRSANGLAFTFARPDSDPEIAHRDLGMAIETLATRPVLDAALKEATARLAENWDEHGFAEQQRLMEAKAQTEQKLASLFTGDTGLD